MRKKFDYLIVGAGIFGATFAQLATAAGKRCLVIDKRSHIGGNLYCDKIEGINIHTYGAHIFYTSNKKVWDYVTSFVPFNRFTNAPLAHASDGKLYNLPFNMNTFNQMWGVTTPDEAKAKLDEQRNEAITKMRNEGVSEPRNLEEQALCLVGKDIYEKLIKYYTEKQWGRPCTELPSFIIRRLPVRLTYDNNYYFDHFQGVPEEGYNGLIERMLEGCEIRLNTDFSELRNNWHEIADRLIYTGALDEFFGYRLGRLAWRTLRFETSILDKPNFQGNAVINYTDPETPWTRLIEHKHFETFGNKVYENPKTVISKEFSTEYHPGMEPYYPVNDERNEKLADDYRRLSEQLPDVFFGGRLAEYRYYNMASTIESAFELFRKHAK